MDNRLNKAMQLCGILQKRSPSLIKGYQKRYFSIRNEGKYLIYWKKKPINSKDNPQGMISIESISTIANVKGSDTEFILVVEERQFQLKTDTATQRELWVESIAILKEHLKTKENNQQDSDQSKQVQKVKWQDLDKETMTKIKLEIEKDHLDMISNKIDIKNDEVMKCKGIYPYLIKFDARTQEQFIICGFLMKKGKNAQLTRAKKRWFIMISSVPINGQETDKIGPTQADIPDTFQLDTIYYFAYEDRGDKSNFLGKVPIDEVTEIEEIDKSAGSYGLRFYYNEREYNFFADTLTDIQKWILAIKSVKARPKDLLEKKNSSTEKKEEIIFEGQLQRKKNKLLKGPLSWSTVNVSLKKNSLSWTAVDKDDSGNQYVLLIYIKEVIGQTTSFQIFTNDGQEYKFKAQAQDQMEQWVKQIKEQVEKLKGSIQNLEEIMELPPEEASKIDPNQQFNEADLYDDETITDKFYNKMTLQIEKSKQEETMKSNSFFSKVFCCFGGGESEYDYVKDRGF